MDPNVLVALIAGAVSVVTLALGEAFRRFKSRLDKRQAEAEAHKAEAAGDAAITDSVHGAFKTIYDRQQRDIDDLRERMRLIEAELLTTRRECETLRSERDEARTELAIERAANVQLRGEVAILNATVESLRRPREN